MNRLLMTVLALGSMLHAAEKSVPTVTVSGTVKDSANPLEGVTVTLAKMKSLSMVTKANGAFTLTNVTSVLAPQSLTTSHGFSFRNNTIVFTAGSEKVSGSMSLRSIDGRQIASAALNNLQAGEQTLALPPLSSGTYLFTATVGNQSFTRSLICMGSTVFLENESVTADATTSFSLKKQSASANVDTLIASKEGFDTTRFPLTSYTKDGIAVVMKKKSAGGAFTITSTAFKDGDEMPDKYTCEGKSMGGEIAPPLEWSGIPAEAKSLAMFFKDLTAAAGSQPSMGYHWGMWNIPVTVTKMPEGLSGTSPSTEMGGATQKGANGTKFFGPCPDFSKKGGIKDTYKLTLYAFKTDKITPPTTDMMKLAKYFEENAFDSTGISVWSDAKPK